MTLADLILDSLQSIPLPQKQAQIGKLVKPLAGRAATPKAVTEALDALVGAVRELGQMTGVHTPFTDALMGLTRVFVKNLQN